MLYLLLTVLAGCHAEWVSWDGERLVTSGAVAFLVYDNDCQKTLEELGYPVLIQEEVRTETASAFAIHYQDEPPAWSCGGMMVETTNGPQFVVAEVEEGQQVTLWVPNEPPSKFEVVSWGASDNPHTDLDWEDEFGLWWSGPATSADQALHPNGHRWWREDLPNDEGELTPYLVLDAP